MSYGELIAPLQLVSRHEGKGFSPVKCVREGQEAKGREESGSVSSEVLLQRDKQSIKPASPLPKELSLLSVTEGTSALGLKHACTGNRCPGALEIQTQLQASCLLRRMGKHATR